MKALLTFILISLISYSFAQNFDWFNTAGGIKPDKGTKTVTDSEGNILITGYYNEQADFGPFNTGFSFASSKEVYVAKLDADGNYLWVRNGLNYYDDRGLGLCVDPDDNVYVTGTCWGGIEFGPLSAYNSTSFTDQIFVLKLDSDGNEIWLKNAGNDDLTVSNGINENGLPQTLYQDDHGQDLISDSQGNIYVTGFLSNISTTVQFATFDAISVELIPEDSIAFVAKLSNDGTWQWVETFGGIYQNRDLSIAVDDEDHVYVTGGFYGTRTFGTSTITSDGSTDIYVVKYDPNGGFEWVTKAGSTLKDRGNDITSCKDGNMYITGEFRDICTFGTASVLDNAGGPSGRDIFVAKITKEGDWVWASRAGSKKGSDRGNGIASNEDGNLFVTGQYSSDASFGLLNLDSNGDSVQIFIAGIDTMGVWRWAMQGGGYDFDRGAGIAAMGCDVYVTGYFKDSLTFGPNTQTPNLDKDIFVLKITNSCFGPSPPEDPIANEMCSLISSNVISPNFDGINDVVFFTEDCNIPVDIVIVNRWGNVVFETTDPTVGWDGTNKLGLPVEEGVYFYRVKTNFTIAPNEEITGFIHIDR